MHLDDLITPRQRQVAHYCCPALKAAATVYVYGSYNRPLSSIWCRVPDTAIVDADYRTTGYHSYLLSPAPLGQDVLDCYELEAVLPLHYVQLDGALDDYGHSSVAVRVACSCHIRCGAVCGEATRTGLRRVGDYNHPVYRVALHGYAPPVDDSSDAGLCVLIEDELVPLYKREESS